MSGNESTNCEGTATNREVENVANKLSAAVVSKSFARAGSTATTTSANFEESDISACPKVPTFPKPNLPVTNQNAAAVSNSFARAGSTATTTSANFKESDISACPKLPTFPKPNLPVTNQNANNAKRVIRKVVIDPKKLQQAGLDRKLAEAIGRQKLKTLAEEQKKKQQSNDSLRGFGDGSIKPKSEPNVRVTKTPTTPQTKKATPNLQSIAIDTGITQTVIKTDNTYSGVAAGVPVIKRLGSAKNELISPGFEKTTSFNESGKNTAISNPTESHKIASNRKVFVTPKITITSPAEASSSSINITPQHRLKNVKHMLQNKILEKQQLAAQALQAKQNFQLTGASTPLLEPKIEKDEVILHMAIGKQPQQPSPAKSPQDIARVLDFSTKETEMTTTGSSTLVQAEHTKNMKNHNVYVPQGSLENRCRSSTEVACLIARILPKTEPASLTTISKAEPTSLPTIPKATIKCEKFPVQNPNRKVYARKKKTKEPTPEDNYLPSLTKSNQKINDIQCKHENEVVNNVAEMPKQEYTQMINIIQKHENEVVKNTAEAPKQEYPHTLTKSNEMINIIQTHENEIDKNANVELNTTQTLDHSQFNNFPLYSPLKQPFPVVTHSQDLPLPTIATFSRTPFPTSLIRIGQMPQSQNNAAQAQTINTKTPASLVVLENKVLTQDEKIDLTGLALATPKTDLTTSMNNTNLTPPDSSASAAAQQPLYKTTESNEITPTACASTSKLNLNAIPADGTKINNRTILSMNKVKLSTQQLAALVKAINANKTNAAKQFVMIRNVKSSAKPNEAATEFGQVKQDGIADNINTPTTNSSNTHMIIRSTSNLNLSTLYANTTFGTTPKAVSCTNIPEMVLPKVNPYATLSYGPLTNHVPQANLLTQHATGSINYLPQQSSLAQHTYAPINYVPHENPLPQHNAMAPINYMQQHINLRQHNSAPTTVGSNSLATKLETQYPQDDVEDIKPKLSELSTATVPKLETLSDAGSQSDTEVQFKNPFPRNMPNMCTTGYNKSSVSIIDSGDESDPSISAVDFIASLAAKHPITEETTLELSPEELNLNASFSKSFSPLRIPNRNRTDSIKSEIYEQEAYEQYKMASTEVFKPQPAAIDVRIGKIITISEEDIGKAVNATKETHNLEIDNKHDTNKEMMQPINQINNRESVNNLDIIKTDDLAELNVSPIIVKNIKISNNANIQEMRSDSVILQNLKNSVTGSFENLNQNNLNILPIKIEGNTNNPCNTHGFKLKNVNKYEETDGCDVNIAGHTMGLLQDSKSISNVETLTPAEISKSSAMTPSCKESTNVVATLNTDKPCTSTIALEQVKTESDTVEKPTASRTVCRTSLITDATSSSNSADEKMNKLVTEETSNVAPKRLPRLMKGKINLVQRRKTPASMQEVKNNTEAVGEKTAMNVEQGKEACQTNVIELKDREVSFSDNKIVEEKERTVVREGTKVNDNFVKDRQKNVETTMIQEKPVESHNSIGEKLNYASPKEDAISNTADTESLLEPADLKRKSAKISDLLHPPKKSKRKSLVDDVECNFASYESQELSMNNILIEALTAVSQEPVPNPAKIPFKKTKIMVNDEEKPIKGIQHLLKKFMKDKQSSENHAEPQDEAVDEAAADDTLIEVIEVDESSSDSLQILNTELATSNSTVDIEESKKMHENKAEQNSIPNSQQNVESKTEQEALFNSVLGVENRLKTRAANLYAPAEIENNEVGKNSEVTKDCDIVNVIANEQIKGKRNESNPTKMDAQMFENIKYGGEKTKQDFLGFDHSSESMQNIDSTLQHLITITNSAEKIKTCEENFSTTERESPHDTKTKARPTKGRPTKSWLTTDKATTKQSNLAQQRRTSMSRRSVPLKKRWEVMPKSEDDIEISDDLTPEGDDDDEEYETNYASLQATFKTIEKFNENDSDKKETESVVHVIQKEVTNKQGCAKGSPAKAVETIDLIVEDINTTSKDGEDTAEQIEKNADISESSSTINLETPTKRTQTKQLKSKKGATAKPADSIEPLKQSTGITKTVVDDDAASLAAIVHKDITADVIPKAKAKRARNAKLKNECNVLNEMSSLVTEAGTTNTADPLHAVEFPDNNNEIGSTKEATKELERGQQMKVSQKREKKSEAERRVDLNQPDTDQGIAAKQVGCRGRQRKITIDDNTGYNNMQEVKETLTVEQKIAPRRKSKGRDLSPDIAEVQVKEEFVSISSELVVLSLKEMEISLVGRATDPVCSPPAKDAVTRGNESENVGMDLLKVLETSTPTNEQTTTKNAKGSKRKRKTLGDIAVTLAKKPKKHDETLNDDNEETEPLLVPKKRVRKPKTKPEPLICNGIADTDTSVASLNDDADTKANASALVTEVADSTQDLTQTAVETPIKIPKKRGRKPKVIDQESCSDLNEDTTNSAQPGTNEVLIPEPKRRGRRTTVDLDARGDFNERLLLITNRAQLETAEVLTAEPTASTSNKKSIQCGLCLKEMARATWAEHLATHYGVGWIVGETPPINVTFRGEVLKNMIAYLKINGGKYPLTCRMCQRTYKSALGILLHIELCGATDTRQKCEYCNTEYAKSSLPIHMRVCSQKMALNQVEKVDEDATKEPVLNNVGRRKRASVQKAEKIIKAIGRDKSFSAISCQKDAKHYIKFVPHIEHLTKQWTKDLESLGKINCPTSNCIFGAEQLEAMQTHFGNCELKETAPKGVYICKICVDSTESYQQSKQAIFHVLREHKNVEDLPDFEADASDCDIKTDDETSDDEVSSSGVDSDEESAKSNDDENDADVKRRKKKKKPVWVNPLYLEKALHPQRDPDYSYTAMRLWAEFKSQQYSTEPLFTDLKVNFNICPNTAYEQYLPQWESSMKFNFDAKLKLSNPNSNGSFSQSKSDIEWSQLKRFEIFSTKTEQLIFIGEAIKIAEWVPLPPDIKEQYLLVSTRRAYTRKKDPKICNTLLWLYKAIPAHGLKPLSIQLHYAINIPDGPVHCLEFLPSGGYDANANRLGLVAIGTPSSTIKVYALPLIVKGEETKNESATNESLLANEIPQDMLRDLITVNLEPVFLLSLDPYKTVSSSHPLVDTQCKALCWSEFSGHTHIFAGYSNGCISYWDITSEINLNRLMVDGVPNYVPFNFFYTRERNIIAMAIHYDNSGVRLLAVALARRLIYIYDLDQFDIPYLLKDEITRNEIMDMEWSPLWQNVALAVGDSFPNHGRCLYAVSPTNIVFKNETIEKFNGAVTQTNYNPMQHILANATDTGDLVLLNLREMHLKEMMSELKGNRAAAIMDVKCLNGTDIPKFDPKSATEDWSYYEKNCSEKYGLVFGPIEKINYKQHINEERRPPLHLITCTRINSLRCNKNFAGRNLLALGYENGLLRVLTIDRNLYFN